MNIKIIALSVLAFAATSGIQAQMTVTPVEDTKTKSEKVTMTSDQAQQQKALEADRIARTNASSAKMATDLGLDEKQTVRLKELDEKYARQLNEVRASTTDRAVISEKDASMRAEHDAELRQILTPEQYQQYSSAK